MNNKEAFNFYMSNSEKAFSTIAHQFITKYNLEESNCDLLRRKFSNIKSERKIYLKEKDLATWEELLFCRDPQMDDIPQSSNEARPFKESTIVFEEDFSRDPQMDDILQSSNEARPSKESTIVFEEDFSRVSRKQISELSNKGMRYRLANLILYLEAVAHREEVSPKMISSYLLLLYSQEEHDVCTANISKNDGFPTKRFISDAKIIFEEVDEERFLSLSSNERFNLAHAPLSDIDIIPGSPLHAYLRFFSWFMSLASHLTAGETKWSLTSTKVQYTKSFICGLLKEKLNLMIDCASSQGGTSTTGNVVRRCLVRKDDSERDFLYWILIVLPSNCKQVITDIHTYLGAILRVYYSSRRIHTDELSLVCRELYQLILTQFSWSNITPYNAQTVSSCSKHYF
ncbi:hypothetical protein LOD99_9162 [Oopsacas minuta]|uniref:Uncharacterized protein n=1 Tax=Oopsacas minuta TaxID=111878 RepID=A0AAV7JDI4_9METZ|nr:hypothetical protein LOD99_9162 [Oopsacas minuta]